MQETLVQDRDPSFRKGEQLSFDPGNALCKGLGAYRVLCLPLLIGGEHGLHRVHSRVLPCPMSCKPRQLPPKRLLMIKQSENPFGDDVVLNLEGSRIDRRGLA